ncbi:uncharacterized protein BX664DRAFT_335401 [Halteromyces radiatus]|uniref:uncharacterized protein n=1 Tax=Halteromyces radiatus TaxID=101107 RepID=UPI00221F5F70|nr:uncharacterized protein BX664DRAFT_335401 [Halteromyces radiatus]KAI8086278.1 hypothetical protein BX664DRAFT_335401 [Halteromyces radiatus]
MILLDHLPVEILSLVVDNINHNDLYHCALVNKRFYTATIPVLWRSPKVDDDPSAVRLTKSLSLARYSLGHYIRKLQFEEAIMDDTLIYFIDRSIFLEELIIMHAEHITDKSIQHLSQQCPQLKKLHLGNANITHRSMHYLGQRCCRLRELALKACHRLLPITLLPFADCPLEYLDLSECRWLTVEDTALDILQLNRLTHLELVCCRTVNAKFIQQLYNNNTIALPHLTYFAITGNPDINDHIIIPFIKTHPHLTSLHILKCNLTDIGLDAIATYLPCIHVLNLLCCENISSQAVRRFIRNCPQLVMIGLENCLLPLYTFPEVQEKDGEYAEILGYTDITAIRLSNDNNSIDQPIQMQEDDTINDMDGVNNNIDIPRHEVLDINDNDDMEEVRAIVLSLSESQQYSI